MPTDLPNSLPSSITSLYDVSSNALVSKGKRYETEIGDVLQADFLPQIKVKRWGNEGNLSLRFFDAKPQTKGTVTASGNAISWEKGGYKVRFYDKGGFDEDGGLEFEIELAQKPPANSIAFTIQTKNLAFYYQGPLTEKEVAAGMTRPDNVVGSYAVYHVSKRDNEYETGKAFHIYRPWAQDAKGVRVWCDFLIDTQAGTATLTVPQAFLDSAVYPVVIDPTFGYTTVGASGLEAGLSYATRATAITATAGDLVDIRVYVSAVNGGSCNTKTALYANSSGAPGSLVSSVGSVTASAGAWNICTVTGTATAGAAWFAASTDTNGVTIAIAYDSSPTPNLAILWAGTLPNPFGTPDANFAFGTFSIYATRNDPAVIARRRALLGVGQ